MTFFIYSLSIFLSTWITPVEKKTRPIWSDEFNYTGLPDSTKWSYHEGDGCPLICGWGNSELQYYTKKNRDNVRVENGKLVIEAHRKQMKNSAYTSTRLRTANNVNWTYGYFEIRAKLPVGRGTWPAIWMLPEENKYGGWPKSGEIDIMEHVGYDPGVIHGTVHTDAFNHIKGTQVGKQDTIPDFDKNFHTYAINWTAQHIEFFIDGKRFHVFKNNGSGTEAWPFDHPYYLIMNIAVGGGWGGRKGIDESIWPQKMEVDYVRVYAPITTDKQRKAFKLVL